MSKNSLDQVMLQLLANYQQLITNQLTNYHLVGEYLDQPIEDNVRLLCQLRTIIFLIKTAPVLTLENITIAETLYQQTETHYLTTNQWLQQLNNNSQEATLYSYSFVLLAQGYLYQATKNPLYSIAIAETFSLIEQKFKENALFKPLEDLPCLEQNSAMHLYEALTFAYYQTNAMYTKPFITQLEALLIKSFWQADKKLLAEKVTFDRKIKTYEAGHWFEWVTLLSRVKSWGGSSFINPIELYQAANLYSSFTTEGVLLNEMNEKLQPINNILRIWPNLEYLRANAIIHQQLPIQAMNRFIKLFFTLEGLPIEYLENTNHTIKSTTGYHIAESFVDILLIK